MEARGRGKGAREAVEEGCEWIISSEMVQNCKWISRKGRVTKVNDRTKVRRTVSDRESNQVNDRTKELSMASLRRRLNQ